jgi:hypothetical protein
MRNILYSASWLDNPDNIVGSAELCDSLQVWNIGAPCTIYGLILLQADFYTNFLAISNINCTPPSILHSPLPNQKQVNMVDADMVCMINKHPDTSLNA